MIDKLANSKQLLAKMNLVLLIEILQQNLVNILNLPFQNAKELNEKRSSLVKVINTIIDIFISKVKLYLKSIPRFDEEYKDTQIRARKFKKNIEKRMHRRKLEDTQINLSKKRLNNYKSEKKNILQFETRGLYLLGKTMENS